MQSDKDSLKMYTTQEVADLLGVSNRTIQLWASSGVLNAWKTPGGHRRFPQDEVHRLRDGMAGAKLSEEQRNVLVLDSEPDSQVLYRINITDWGLPLDVDVASDGYEGLLKIGLGRPEVIILDLQMPRGDGFRVLEVLENAKALNGSLVLVVTAMSEGEIRRKYPVPDDVQIFSKPIPFEKLRQQVIQHLGLAGTRVN